MKALPNIKRVFLMLLLALPLSAAPNTVRSLLQLAPTASPAALKAALSALHRLEASGGHVRNDILTVIDYTKPSSEHRLWVFDLAHHRLLFQELVAHGKNSGAERAQHFSNQPDSLMSSVGAYLTGDTYMGKHGLSLRLSGMDKGFNDNSLSRAIVIHAAAYVGEAIAKAQGQVGRSWGCPAVRPEISRKLIETIRGGSVVMAYYPEPSWLRASAN